VLTLLVICNTYALQEVPAIYKNSDLLTKKHDTINAVIKIVKLK